MKISLDLLHMLDAIERHGSFTAAAAALHRVPSALSHAIAKLEDELGLALFLREGRRATLTPAGRTLLDDGRHLLRAADELERRVQRIATGWESELRIAVDMIIPAERLYPAIGRFYAAGHSTQIHLVYEVLGGVWDALATGRADLAIGAPGDLPARSGISNRLLGHTRLLFMVAPQHPLATCPEPIAPRQLIRHRAIAIADTSRELTARTSGLLEGQDVLRVPDMPAKAAAQAAGLGVGHLPCWLAEQEAAAGRLLEKELSEPRPAMPYYLAWRTRHTGKALQWFLAELAKDDEIAALTAGL
ncbi:LysR substrate-binding domain-containing protein [Dechloromonas denitrificans]|uniref:LysR substrate-binding domain-containing protein n=1 Tax=Dechloromonas denitrificans TaxID=281362 RepID=UPI001CF82793|nr:LysR substrate-binding domain-containing protein [Dechloromonas denitrificans]UCV03031.1 LysR family transcriptional regulator [Dechloromonas denitrificans]UCV07348.1 LysR family transcriptional regulator [Dechloromonas denitrificans]